MRHIKTHKSYTHPHNGLDYSIEACSVCLAEGSELTTDCPNTVTSYETRLAVSASGFDYVDGRGWFYYKRPRAQPCFADEGEV